MIHIWYIIIYENSSFLILSSATTVQCAFHTLFWTFWSHWQSSQRWQNHNLSQCLLTEGNWRTNRDFGVFKKTPRSEWTKFWKFDCHFWSSKSNATFSIFCCNLFPFVETFLLNKGKFWCYNQNLWPRSEVYSDELESNYRSKNEYILKETFEGILT